MKTRIRLFLTAALAAILLLSLSSCASSLALDDWEDAAPHSGQSVFDLLNREEVLEATLTTDLDSLIQNRRTDEYSPGEFSFRRRKGGEQSYQVKVRPRGKFRRKVCDFPPLKLKFSKDELEAAGLAPHNELKLVTHCLDDKGASKDLVLREYLAYKMYNELTPSSLRVQLVRITYRDRANPGYKIQNWGFLLEDKEELAARLGGEPCKDCFGQPAESFHTAQEKIASLFQYMIGNADWSLEMNRNVEMVKTSGGKLVPVPYDFDFAVLVGAPYLRPNTDVKQTGNMERVFMGNAASARELYSTLAYFKTKKQAVLDVVRNFDLLGEETRQGMEAYLETFFNDLGSEEEAQQAMFSKRG